LEDLFQITETSDVFEIPATGGSLIPIPPNTRAKKLSEKDNVAFF